MVQVFIAKVALVIGKRQIWLRKLIDALTNNQAYNNP
jgi:hypothetical protein